jgi:hypothetical protein
MRVSTHAVSVEDASTMLMSLTEIKMSCTVRTSPNGCIAITIVVGHVLWNLTAGNIVILGKAGRLVVSL